MRKSLKKYALMQDSNDLISDYKENKCIIYNLNPITTYYLMLHHLLKSDTQPNNGSKYSGLKFVFSKNFYAKNSHLKEYIDKNNFIIDIQDSNYWNKMIGSTSFIMTEYKTHHNNNNNRFFNHNELTDIAENICSRGLKLYYIIPIGCYSDKNVITEDSLADYQGNSGSINEWCYVDHTMQYLKKRLHYPIYRIIVPFINNAFANNPFNTYLSQLSSTDDKELVFSARNTNYLSSSRIDLEDHIMERDFMCYEKIAECLYWICQDSAPKNYLIGTDTKISYNELSLRDRVNHKLIPRKVITNNNFLEKFGIENYTKEEYKIKQFREIAR